MRSRRWVCGVCRQVLKAVALDVQACVAWVGEAEEEWWTMFPDEAQVTGKVSGVWRGLLLMRRGITESGAAGDIVLVQVEYGGDGLFEE
jgi:hypothetical protein